MPKRLGRQFARGCDMLAKAAHGLASGQRPVPAVFQILASNPPDAAPKKPVTPPKIRFGELEMMQRLYDAHPELELEVLDLLSDKRPYIRDLASRVVEHKERGLSQSDAYAAAKRSMEETRAAGGEGVTRQQSWIETIQQEEEQALQAAMEELNRRKRG